MNRPVLICLIIGLIHCLFWYAWPQGTLADKHQYHTLACNMLDGRGFSLDTAPPYQPTIYRTPTYPVFIAAVYSVCGRGNEKAVYLMQIGLFLLLVVLVISITQEISGSVRTARLAGLLVALHPGLASFTCEMMTGLLYTFLLVLFVWLFLRDRFLLSGLCVGAAILCRPVAMHLPFVVVVFCLFIPKDPIRLFMFLMVSWMVCIPWCARNQYQFGEFIVNRGMGEVLYQHVAFLDDPQLHNATLLASASESLARLYWPDYHRKTLFRITEDRMIHEIDSPLSPHRWHSGRAYLAVDSAWTAAALRLIREHPVRYAQKMAASVVDSHSNIFVPQLAHWRNYLPVHRPLLLLLKLTMLCVVVLSLLSVRKHWRNPKFMFVVVVAAYGILALMPITGGARYVLCNQPLYLIMVAMYWRENEKAKVCLRGFQVFGCCLYADYSLLSLWF